MVEVACPTTRQGLAAEAAGGGDKRMKNETQRAGVYLLAAVLVVALGWVTIYLANSDMVT